MKKKTKNTDKSKFKKVVDKHAGIASETLFAITTTDTYEEAAKMLGISAQALTKRRKKYEIDKRISEMTVQALERLQSGSLKAANKLVELIDDKRYEFEASKEVLDRAGVGVKKSPSVAQQFNIGGEMSLEFTTDE